MLVTTMSTGVVEAVPAGDVAVIFVDVLTVKVALVEPNFTAVVPVKPVPVMVMDSPPAALPAAGLTPVTLGDMTTV